MLLSTTIMQWQTFDFRFVFGSNFFFYVIDFVVVDGCGGVAIYAVIHTLQNSQVCTQANSKTKNEKCPFGTIQPELLIAWNERKLSRRKVHSPIMTSQTRYKLIIKIIKIIFNNATDCARARAQQNLRAEISIFGHFCISHWLATGRAWPTPHAIK